MLNARRERGMEDHKVEGLSEEQIAELGDESYVSFDLPQYYHTNPEMLDRDLNTLYNTI